MAERKSLRELLESVQDRLNVEGMNEPYPLADAFASYLETDSAQKNPKSARADRRFLEIALYYFATVRNKTLVSQIRLEDLQTFQLWLGPKQTVQNGEFKEPWSDTTIEYYCRVLKKFFRKMHHTDRVAKNPAELWKVPRGMHERRRPMTFAEYSQLLEAAPKWFRTILQFMYLTGSRPIGASTLTWGDVDIEKGVVYIKSRKGGLKKMKVISIPIYPALADFLATLECGPKNDTVFRNRLKFPVTAQEISTEGSRLIRKVVGLSGVVLYGLRHALAVDLTESGISLEITRQAMGHSSLAQTSHYAQGIASKSVADAFNQIRKDSKK